MPEFTLTRESLNTVTDVEIAFGTTRLLPPFDAVPEHQIRAFLLLGEVAAKRH